MPFATPCAGGREQQKACPLSNIILFVVVDRMSSFSIHPTLDATCTAYSASSSLKETLQWALGVGLFIGIFFVVFQPFGTAQTDSPYALLWLFSIGIVNSGLVLLNEWAWRPLHQRLLPTPLHRSGVYLGLDLLHIAVGNFLYINLLCGFQESSIWDFISFVGITGLIALFPLTVLAFISHIRTLEDTPSASPHHPKISLYSANNKEQVCLPTADLLWIQADKNYVLIVYAVGDTVKRHVLRNTLSAIEAQLADTPLVRCHRSYLVNMQRMDRITVHRDGLHLYLRGAAAPIPASKRYKDMIRTRIAPSPS